MGCKYVKEFDFGTKGKDGSVKYAMGGKVTGYAKGGACYAEGGSVKADMKQDKAMVKAAVHKHEKALHKGEPLTKLARGGKVEAPGFVGQTMIKDTSSLGIKGNKNPGIKGSKPVAPDLPTLKLAKGGAVMEKATGEKYPSRQAMVKHEKMETPRMQREELTERAQVKMPAPRRKMVPVAPATPMIGMKTGGKVSQSKVGKVMGEFKAGDLHSGKNGKVVTKPKQAIAIALSEGRKAAKR